MDADCIERLRLQADAVEENGRLLLADCARVLRQGAVRGRAWDEACMDLSMAREALDGRVVAPQVRGGYGGLE